MLDWFTLILACQLADAFFVTFPGLAVGLDAVATEMLLPIPFKAFSW